MFSLLLFFTLVAASPGAPQDPIPADTEVITTASGLKYSVLVEGSGDRHPQMGELVRVRHTGWLTDGTEFDSSYGRKDPVQYQLGQVIEGWNEGLQLMTTGAKYKFTVPPELGYGASGSGPIPANATLIFVLELVDIVRMPVFEPLVPGKYQKTATGIEYQILKEGEGECAKAHEVAVVRYAFWNESRQLLDCTESTGGKIEGPVKDSRFEFLKEILLLMRPGSVLRVKVPPALCFGNQAVGAALPANSVTHWRLELERVLQPLPLPEFRKLDDSQTVKSPTGLLYQVLKVGTGDSPKFGEMCKVNYCGWLVDGTYFDSSFSRGQPAEFAVGAVIQGWNEALQNMREGEQRLLRIPATLAYGTRGSPPKIPANATLIFYIELIEVMD